MQSGGFGGVSEIQPFMVDGSAHPFFSIPSTTPPPPHSSSSAAAAGGHEIYHPAAFHRPQYPHPSPPPPHFPHFHTNIPITQQLFTPPPPPHHHHFQLFHEHHRRLLPSSPSLDPPDQENHPPPSYLPADMKFKLAADENASESRLRSWHREETCAIKEPFWRPLDLDYINSNNKRCKEKESADLPFAKRSRAATGELENSPSHHQHHHHHPPGNNYKPFSELEAIYKPGGIISAAAEPPNNQTTGSGSALTGDDHPLIPPSAAAAFDLDYRLEDDNSTGGEAHTNLKKAPHHHSRRRRRRRRRQMKSIAAFFQGLLKQLMDHQESLHQKFLNLMEQRDAERVSQEDARREQESARARRDAAARAHDRDLAAAREAAILSFLQKITGETITLPSPPPNSADKTAIVAKGTDFITSPTSRWPKIEVQALIQVRSGLDGQFQEPGLKGPLWEEVSAAMTALGYHRSAKRCKEKWENINKYFRKSKDSGRKRSLHSKTCPYFHQLDQLYGGRRVKNSELLDAVVVAGASEEVGESEGRREEEEEEEEEASQFVEQLQ